MQDLIENIGCFLARRAHRHPGLEALVVVESGVRLTYKQLNERANRIANGLSALGVNKGDRIGFLLKNRIEYIESFFGAAKIGAIIVPLNWRLAPDELKYILKDAGCTLLFYESEFDSAIGALRESETNLQKWVRVGGSESRPEFAVQYDDLYRSTSGSEPTIRAGDDDPLFIMYTSGTTGRPKGVVQTHGTMLWASLSWNMTCDMRHQDRHLIVLPVFHIGGLLPLISAVHRAQTVVLMGSTDPNAVRAVIASENVTVTHVVTTMFRRLLLEGDDQGTFRLRWVIVGGEAVPPSLVECAAARGIEVLQDYGSTEAGPVTIMSSEDAVSKAGSCGKPHFHTEVRVIDDRGADVGPDEIGEIVVRARHIMKGYWNRPHSTSEVLRDGWFYTGDLATIDSEGFLYIKDRKRDMIISGGENIYPAEVERVLMSHPHIREVAVIGQRSEKWGETPVAIVVLKDGTEMSLDCLISFCRGKIAGYKIPRSVEFVSELPRTVTGKVQKNLLRERFPGPVSS